MKTLMGFVLATMMATACTYAPGGVTADGKVVIAKNDGFLFGLLGKVFVCNVTPGGVTGCVAGDAP